MALDRVSYPNSTPTVPGDWTQLIALMVQAHQKWNGEPARFYSDKIPQGEVLNIGGTIYKGTSDTSITGTPSNYVKVIPNGATASAEYSASLSGVSWNAAYNGLYDGDGNLYLVKAGLVTVLTSGSGTYISPTGRFKVTAIGGGGNGGDSVDGSPGPSAGGGGGGGGGSAIKRYVTAPMTSFSYSVGAQGANTTFDTITASGGSNGATATAGFPGDGGAGGAATGGDINIPGESGGLGTASATVVAGGRAGGTILGGSGRTTNADGGAGIANTGGGGAGAASVSSFSGIGGTGAAGVIIIEEQ